MTGEEDKLPPLPPQRSFHDTSPELALVDRDLTAHAGGKSHADPHATFRVPDFAVRDAVDRLCELADVNPVRTRKRRLLAFSGVVTLWVEAVILLVALSPSGLP